MIRALIFDFDGLILETETTIYQSWQEVFQSYDCKLLFDDWSTIIGSANVAFNPMDELEKQLGRDLDREQVEALRWQREYKLVLKQPIMPGVQDALDDAKRLGLHIGLASSSPCEWVVGHLSRLGLIEYFETIKGSDDVALTKPDPALYLEALSALNVPGERAVALEDSPHGVLAAKRAGMYTVAVPNDLTRRMPFQGVDLRLDSLADMPLKNLLAELTAGTKVSGASKS